MIARSILGHRARMPLLLALVALVALVAACSSSSGNASAGSSASAAATASPPVATTPVGEWRSLIDPALSAWRGYREQGIPKGWSVADGVLAKTEAINDLVSRDEFESFELEFDWKIHARGNAGVFYRGTEEFQKMYFTAPEYQLLDDPGHPDGRNPLTSAGANYALHPAPRGVVKPADQWNTARIVVRGQHVEHWLNGQKLLEYQFGSPDWEAKMKASKFATWPKYGRIARGRIGIQGDHTGELSLRNMRIRELQ